MKILSPRALQLALGGVVLTALGTCPPIKPAVIILCTGLKLALGLTSLVKLFKDQRLQRLLGGFLLTILSLILFLDQWNIPDSYFHGSTYLKGLVQLMQYLSIAELGLIALATLLVVLYCMLHHFEDYLKPIVLRLVSQQRYQTTESSSDACSVCLQPLLQHPVKPRSCPHRFHLQCIMRVAQFDERCPICRHGI